jgi:hypothetical protein
MHAHCALQELGLDSDIVGMACQAAEILMIMRQVGQTAVLATHQKLCACTCSPRTWQVRRHHIATCSAGSYCVLLARALTPDVAVMLYEANMHLFPAAPLAAVRTRRASGCRLTRLLRSGRCWN